MILLIWNLGGDELWRLRTGLTGVGVLTVLNGVLIAWAREHVSMIMMESAVEERSDLNFFFLFLS